jgi:hypothetical protein
VFVKLIRRRPVSKDAITKSHRANVQKFQPDTLAPRKTITCMHVHRELFHGFQVLVLVSNVVLESMQPIEAP